MKRLHVIADWMQGTALSGGDRIFIELVKRWQNQLKITLFLSKEGAEICKRHGLENLDHQIWASDRYSQRGYFRDYLYRTWVGIKNFRKIQPQAEDGVFSTSDFGPDSIPALLLKLSHPEICWIAGFYLFSPRPWQKDSPYKGKRWWVGLFYWLSQAPLYYLVKKYADVVFVTSEPDVKKFITAKRDTRNIIVIRGGVDTGPADEHLNAAKCIPVEDRTYDACFLGRFHYQKGVLDLLKIWKQVCEVKSDAKLAMIGTGPLEEELREQIIKTGLENQVDLLGFRIGQEKFDIFIQSKIVVHPATYDSGGMAAAEAMAWGLPGVGFDLEALKTYYPKGMLKSPCFDHRKFAENILRLLNNYKFYNELSCDARNLIREQWNWDHRATVILSQVQDAITHSNKIT
ncbi:hypothetical protein UR09_05020 [Candidatus Nitromaritima sp. SCGC AAA799-A02]|nr:hypothetical protein UR09_05020 [Candidatus Nitromaritima sp. SCGC AAA799-A02]